MNPPNAPHHKAPFGLRTVAVYEFAKGLLVLVAGLSLLTLVHKDVQNSAQELLRGLHVDPAWHYSRLLIENSSKLTDNRLQLLAGLAGVYAVIRFVITYGLWHEKHWAEWLTAISAGIYIPFEIHHLIRKPGLASVVVLVLNLAVVVYLARVLMANRRERQRAREEAQNPS